MAQGQGTFASLRVVPNYRRYFAGTLISNIGTWVARVAQDWLVLTVLTDHSAAALGLVTTVQFMWIPLLSGFTGTVADRFNKRSVLFVTQSAMGLTSLVLAALTLSGTIVMWQVYVLAGAMGIAAAFDGPARMAFVSEMVPGRLLTNAVGLSSASLNTGRLVGPAVGGLLIAAFGVGVGLAVNTVSFVALLIALATLDPKQLHPAPRRRGRGALAEGLAYVRSRKDLQAVLALVFVLATFGMNYPVTTALMATTVFGKDAAQYGVLGSVLAIGSLTGALLGARRERPRLRYLVVSGLVVAITGIAMGIAPTYLSYLLLLAPAGLASMTALTTANSMIQLATDPSMRGRVLAVYLAINLGGMPIGAFLIGQVAEYQGVRTALVIGGGITAVAFLVALVMLTRSSGAVEAFRERIRDRRPHRSRAD